MKNKLLIIAAIGGIVGGTQIAHAVNCTGQNASSETLTLYDAIGNGAFDLCSKRYTDILYTDDCSHYVILEKCLECVSGYYIQVTGSVNSRYFTGGFDYTSCLPNESNCTASNCKSDTDWKPGNAGYLKKENRNCVGGKCTVVSGSYMCAAGYYGTSTNGTTGCTRCPSSGGVYGLSDVDSADISYCYIPRGTKFSDSTGSGEYAADCYWDE